MTQSSNHSLINFKFPLKKLKVVENMVLIKNFVIELAVILQIIILIILKIDILNPEIA